MMRYIKFGILFLMTSGIAMSLMACVSNDPVCYYGCPNSKRIEKLNLRRKKIKE